MNNGAKRIDVMLVVIMSILMTGGCATTSELRKLSIGMDKKEVVNVLGEPISTRASTRTSGTIEIWDYRYAKTVLGFPPFIRDTYWLFFKENRLSQWSEETCRYCADQYLKPASPCKPLLAFDTLVISPFDGDAAFVEEEQYRHLPHDIAVATTDRLKDQMENSHIFSKVVRSPDCTDNAIKIDGKIYSLLNHRGFHAGVRGQIISCQTGESLYKFDNDDESDGESYKLPIQIAEKIADGIKAKLICENLKGLRPIETAPITETAKDKI